MDCEGCAKRREQIADTFRKMVDWVKTRDTPKSPFEQIAGVKTPRPPLLQRPPAVKSK